MVRIVLKGKSVIKYNGQRILVTWFLPSVLEAERFAYRLGLRYR
jgi:hypothetical protein